MTAIQLGRRLQKITASMENFFHSQIDRLENALAICQRDLAQSHAIRQMLTSFAQQKQCWEAERQAEIASLDRACGQLTDGWKQLENARRQWLAEQVTRQTEQADNVNRASSAWVPVESFPLKDETSGSRSGELNNSEFESLRLAIRQHRNLNDRD